PPPPTGGEGEPEKFSTHSDRDLPPTVSFDGLRPLAPPPPVGRPSAFGGGEREPEALPSRARSARDDCALDDAPVNPGGMLGGSRRRVKGTTEAGTMTRVVMDPVLERFHPAVRAWFSRRFTGPTEPQRHGWPAIGA